MKLTIARKLHACGWSVPEELTITSHSAHYDQAEPDRRKRDIHLALVTKQKDEAKISMTIAQARHVAAILLDAAAAAERLLQCCSKPSTMTPKETR